YPPKPSPPRPSSPRGRGGRKEKSKGSFFLFPLSPLGREGPGGVRASEGIPLIDPQAQKNEVPVVASVEMGYGHLRAAHALASALGTEVLHVDRPPLVAPEELRLWRTSRRFYEITSRADRKSTRL